jgi:hypothetical protein
MHQSAAQFDLAGSLFGRSGQFYPPFRDDRDTASAGAAQTTESLAFSALPPSGGEPHRAACITELSGRAPPMQERRREHLEGCCTEP